MDTKRSLPRYLLLVVLVLFLICGFTVTPIAAAKIEYMSEAHTGPASPELIKQYSASTANASRMTYKELVAACGGDTLSVAAAGNYLQHHPKVTEGAYREVGHTPLIIDDLSNLPPADPRGYYVSITADDIMDYLQHHPEYQGGVIDGQSFTAADVYNYLQNNPEFETGLYFDPKDVWNFIWITLVTTFAIGVCAALALGIFAVADAIADLILLGLGACSGVVLFVGLAVILVVNIVYWFIEICENGWEQLLILPVLFALWPRKRKMQRISPSAHDSCA